MSIFAKVKNCLKGSTPAVDNSEEELSRLREQLAFTRGLLADVRWDREILRVALDHASPDVEARSKAFDAGTWAACGSSFEKSSEDAWSEYQELLDQKQ